MYSCKILFVKTNQTNLSVGLSESFGTGLGLCPGEESGARPLECWLQTAD